MATSREHNQPSFTVVSIATNLPGPTAAKRFCELGAEVIKVEPPSGDPMRLYNEPYYTVLAEGQQILTLDLKSPSGMTELHRLLSGADIFLTSHRTGALTRLGLAWDELHAQHPRLSQVAIVGHGDGEGNIAGHDLTYQAHAGTLTPPQLPTIPVADMAGSERAVSEGMAALWETQITGEGTFREVALADMAEEFGAPAYYGLSNPGSLLGGGLPHYGLYEAADGGWVAIALLEPHFLDKATQLLDISGSKEDYRTVIATKTAAEWERWAREHSLPIAAVREAG
ncbi:CoA transferase [Corynebacterium anserum]|uniref:CoA transferase n=1 Tax=Corynebacterium anserum TaxID=2684406 RepID=A0A7G7YQC6_9CORY|nr:CaiB/BaiF CoA-transferase family protein [Corynebacterium anserum]MBC2682379.1 CoA transferase [Corynebacterium anserum]QNH96696.1 CoA transferase [Corynebacterium anserum]